MLKLNVAHSPYFHCVVLIVNVVVNIADYEMTLTVLLYIRPGVCSPHYYFAHLKRESDFCGSFTVVVSFDGVLTTMV